MRDPKRIKKMLKLLEQYWTDKPDLRFGQIVALIESDFYGRSSPSTELFYIEDIKIKKFLEEKVKKLKIEEILDE